MNKLIRQQAINHRKERAVKTKTTPAAFSLALGVAIALPAGAQEIVAYMLSRPILNTFGTFTHEDCLHAFYVDHCVTNTNEGSKQ